MPTPVSAARQCLTPEAAQALDEAVAVARRRGHAQTTSLHAVSALLSLPSSALREACSRARNNAYSPRLQFKALELCLGVSLDRVSSTPSAADPPVSNSLMAAIKRSQANQRRQPENYHLYHQVPNQSTITCVKVELQHLTLSILDDPVVSRVFGEAGFRSTEIKMAILRPFSQLLKYSRYRGPPVFLCNLAQYQTRNAPPPFGVIGSESDVDGNSRRIGEILGRSKARNPLLVGVCAYDALRNFAGAIEKRNESVLPPALSGVTLISIENEISGNGRLFREVSRLVERCSGPGVVVSYGDLKTLISGDGEGDSDRADGAISVVGEITRLLEVYGGKVWLIGATVSYESYLKFLSKFPSVEKDWDLQLVPITSLRSSSSFMADSYPRSSLMDSFVPFGGFFSAPSDLKFPPSSSMQCLSSRAFQCSNDCEQEVSDVSKDGFASIAEQSQSSLPSWLQMAALRPDKGLDVKIKDDGEFLNTKGHHHDSHLSFPTIVGFQSSEFETGFATEKTSTALDGSSNKTRGMDLNSCIPTTDTENISASQTSVPLPAASRNKNESFLSKDEERESSNSKSLYRSVSISSTSDRNQRSPVSATSVTTDLGLGNSYSSGYNKLTKSQSRNHIELLQDISDSSPKNVDIVEQRVVDCPIQSSSSSTLDNHDSQFDPRDVKMLFKALLERVSWQWEAISVISQAIVRCRTRGKCHSLNQRGDIWLSFIGPDRLSKKKIAIALAEVLYGRRENMICVDLSFQNGMIHSDMDNYHVKFRGKNVVDYIAAEMSKKPLAVVFLENADKSDLLLRKSLSRAISTGKFLDSYGREVSTNNTTFVTTSSTFAKDLCVPISPTELSNYSEERILKIKGRLMRIVVECATKESGASQSRIAIKGALNPIFVNKRKLIGANESVENLNSLEIAKRAHKKSSGHLDLNLPAEDNDCQQTNEGNSENTSESSEAWLQDFLDQVDETAVFKPVEFDLLAEKIFKHVKDSFHNTVHSTDLLEIEAEVIEQLLAAAYFSDKYKIVDEWVDQVLKEGFVEIQKMHSLNAHSIVKLITCEGLISEAQPQTVFLPPTIILN